jgi:hypothetical protein
MYKKLLLAFVSIIAIQTVKAQTEKGSQMLGVSFGVSTTSSDNQFFDYSTNALSTKIHGKATNYSIAPTFSYFVANNLDLGVSVGYSHQKQDYDGNIYNPTNSKQDAFNAGIYLRKYFLYDGKIGIRTGPMFNYGHAKLNQEYTGNTQNNYEATSNTYSGGVGLDFVYFPVKRLGLTAVLGGLSYAHQDTKGTNPSTSNSFDASFANRFIFSINYAFGN